METWRLLFPEKHSWIKGGEKFNLGISPFQQVLFKRIQNRVPGERTVHRKHLHESVSYKGLQPHFYFWMPMRAMQVSLYRHVNIYTYLHIYKKTHHVDFNFMEAHPLILWVRDNHMLAC